MNYLEAIKDYGEDKLENDMNNVTMSENFRDISFGVHSITESLVKSYELDEENAAVLDDYIFFKVIEKLAVKFAKGGEENE